MFGKKSIRQEISPVPKIRIEDVQLFLKPTDWSAITDDIDSL